MKKKILVLDDSPFMLQVLGDMLSNLNYEVTTVDNGNLACQMAEATRYNMIITDMNMPAMDGIEFTRQVKRYPSCKFIPIIMLSSDEDINKITEAKQVGVSTFLRKPLNEKQFKAILQVTLNKRRFPRIPLKLTVSFGSEDAIALETFSSTFNVSAGGLFWEAENPPPVGETLKLKVVLPDNNHTIHCKGRVAWVNSMSSPIRCDHPAGMGVEFLSLEDERLFQNFVKNLSSKS